MKYFLNALEKIPAHIEKYEAKNKELSKDIPILQEVVNTPWRKEDELKELKTELAALERKILLSLTPLKEEKQEENHEEQQFDEAVDAADNAQKQVKLPDNRTGKGYKL